MALTYSLKYKKLNFFNKAILEKEGEVIVDRQSFRLKGKGAQDQGEVIYFGDIKDLHVKEDYLSLTTYKKEKFILSDFSNLFDDFLKDFLRVRNDFLAESLFMKVGMLLSEYEGYVEVTNKYGKTIPKGQSKIQLFEGSIVIVPDKRECFSVNYGLLKGHEFNEDEYVFHLYLENGQNINISKLGTSFEDLKDKMESILGKMYEKAINSLNEFLPEFDAQTQLKFISSVKEGRFIPFKALKKIHDDMPSKIDDLFFGSNPEIQKKVSHLRKEGGEENYYTSLSFAKSRDTGDTFARCWFLQAIPEKNLIAIGRTSGRSDNTIHFFRIIMQKGDPLEKLSSKILEIAQSLLIFHFDFSVVYKDRRELRRSRYKTAIKKLSFLRLLRKSYIGHISSQELSEFKSDLKKMYDKASISPSIQE